MIACEDEGSRQAIWIGAFGLVLIHLAGCSRTSLPGRSSGPHLAAAETFVAPAGSVGIGAPPFGTADDTPAFGSGGARAEGSEDGGITTPIGAAPDARKTPPTSCTVDGWCGALGDYVAIWGSSAFDIYVAANNVRLADPSTYQDPALESALLHWNGLEWITIEIPDAQAVTLSSIWGSSANDVWVAGSADFVMHFDGAAWTRMSIGTLTQQTSSVWGTGPSDVWVVGSGIHHFDGAGWSDLSSGLPYHGTSVWSTAVDLWVVIAGTPLRSQDFAQSWSPAPPNPGTPNPSPAWNVVWGYDVEAPFAAGQDGALGHWTDGGWVAQSVGESGSLRHFRSLWGLSSEDVWAVGEGGIVAHWDGTSWTAGHPTSASLRGVWGTGDRYFAVGDQGTFLEFEAAEWVGNPLSAHPLNAIWGGAPNDVWAVGQDTVHWDGASWAKEPDPADLELNGVWGSDPLDVWGVGNGGTLLHWDGAKWSFITSPCHNDLTGVWGSGPDDVWIVDAGGLFCRYSGGSWELWPSDSFGSLATLYGNNASDVVAAGDNGVRVHFDGDEWSPLPDHPVDHPAYLTAFGDGNEVLVGGAVYWSGFMAGGAYPELARWDGKELTDNLEPSGDAWNLGQNELRAGWAGSRSDVWVAVPELLRWDGTAWTYAATSRTIGITALGATSDDIWAASNTGQMLRKKRN